MLHQIRNIWVLYFLTLLFAEIGLKTKIATIWQKSNMFLLNKFIKSSFNTTSSILSISPSCQNISSYLLLSLLICSNIKSTYLLLHQHTLIQYYSTICLRLLLLEYRTTCELFLPKIWVIRKKLNCVFEKIVIYGVAVTFF